MTDYATFLDSKRKVVTDAGFEVDPSTLNPALFDFQKKIIAWAIGKGRAAIFAGTGLGKSAMTLEWARHIYERTGKPVIILAPLAVSRQFEREGGKFHIDAPIAVCRSQADVRHGINITNYEMLEHFTPAGFGGIVTDEASILKNYLGSMRQMITRFAGQIQYRLAATATPAPNDITELINQAEYLGIMTGKEILALWFTQDGNTTHTWRLKGHARQSFWAWLATWAVAVRKPSDLGFDDGAYILPPLHYHQHTVASPHHQHTTLFAMEAQGIQEVREAMRASLPVRVAKTAELVNASDEPWIVWGNLNAETEALTAAIPDAVEVRGSDSPYEKEARLMAFIDGKVRVLVTKPSIAGHGLNLQHCRNIAFVGLSYSWEQYYQAIRRCWRFGQTREVHCHVITSEAEGSVVAAIERKEAQAEEMMAELVRYMSGMQLGAIARQNMEYNPAVLMRLPSWMKERTA